MHSDGNIFSILAFFLWIPIALWGARRWPPAKTASLLLLLPLMFLPQRVYFDLPGFPKFTKLQIAVVWLLIGVLLFHRDRLRGVQFSKWIKLCMWVLIGGSIVTVFTNLDPISEGAAYMSGHRPYDAVNNAIRSTTNYIIPFVLAAAMFNSAKDLRVLFRVLVGAALVYSVFVLIEVRLSPQFHNRVYGLFTHTSFAQMKRGGGFRSSVFMAHALTVSMFLALAVLAAATLYRGNVRVFRVSAIWAMVFLWVVLLVNKGVASFLYVLVTVPVVLFLTPKTQFRAASLLAAIVLLYPILRGPLPVNDIREVMEAQFGEERARSLMTRFNNEEGLLQRASERPFFGWGTYGRSGIYSPWSGRETSIADGDWIITLGEFGFVGFLSKYLLLLLPIFSAARRMRYIPRQSDRRFLSALALMVGLLAFDLLPNGVFYYLPFVLSGALVGSSTGMIRDALQQKRLKQRHATAHQFDAEGRPALA